MSAPAPADPSAAAPMLGIGQVRHSRLRPVVNRFAYPAWFLMLPMRSWRDRPDPALPRNRFGLVSFYDRDHGEGGSDCVAWIESLLRREGVGGADGEIWLQTFARVLGHAFKPVSFWYCHRTDATLAAIVVEVNNTFGERHCYLLRDERLAFGRELCVAKAFHVSPFCRIEGGYRFRFLRTAAAAGGGERVVARVDHDDRDGALLETSISGRLEPLTRAALRRAFLAMPLFTFGVVARIHAQAAKLWWRRVPFVRKPEPPQAFVTPTTPT